MYFLAGRWGLEVNAVSGFATLLWPPTGISLAAFLIWGRQVWPGVFIGAFTVNWATGAPVVTSLFLALGNTLEAWLGAYLLQKFGFDNTLRKLKDVILFFVLGAFLSTLVSSTIGVTTLLFSDLVTLPKFFTTWRAWWTGDILSDLIIAPAILVGFTFSFSNLRKQKIEAAVLFLSLIVVGFTIFGKWQTPLDIKNYPFTFILIPFAIWASLRFTQLGAAVATVIINATAIISLLSTYHSQSMAETSDQLLIINVFVGVIAILSFVLASVMTELIAAESKAHAANKSKDEFLAVISHELRTPLNIIYGWLQLLEKENYLGHTKAFDAITRNTQILSELINELLDISRIVTGKLKLDSKIKRLDVLIEQIINSHQFLAKERGITLLYKKEKEITANIDSVRLQQAISNLISNSFKFTDRGGEVTVTLKTADSMAVIEVIDTGCGIEEDFLPYIFDKFQQAQSVMVRNLGGLGLGLTIAKQIVELHNGIIHAYSKGRNKGSTFVIQIPYFNFNEITL